MSFNFPNNPNLNDQLQIDDNIYVWNGVSWDLQRSLGGINSISEDLNPVLGGSLDLGSHNITGNGNVDIVGNISAEKLVGNINSEGDSSFSGSVNFDGSNILNFPESVIKDALLKLSISDFGDIDTSGLVLSDGQVLSWNQDQQSFVPTNQIGVGLKDLSVGPESFANGNGSISYDDTTGVFTFTPPDLSRYVVSGSLIEATEIEPIVQTEDNKKGSDLTVAGGDSEGLGSGGGDVNVIGGTGILGEGDVNIGTTQTNNVYVGASGINVYVDGNATFARNALFDTGVQEKFGNIINATGVVTHDCDNGHIFRHAFPISDFTANFTNLELSSNYATTLTLVIKQDGNARIPNAVQIEGLSQTVSWQGGVVPTGTDDGIDVLSFSILNAGSSYLVLGQLVDFA